MQTLYLEILSEVDGDYCYVPIKSLIIAFVYRYCNVQDINIVLKLSSQICREPFKICLSGLKYDIYSEEHLPKPASFCQLPVIVLNDSSTCIAGLCAVTRQIFKSSSTLHHLLGFKQNCLYACAEASLWTRFCEIDAPLAAAKIFHSDECFVPRDILRFEGHLAQPVRIHNIQKMKQDMIKASGGSVSAIPDARLQITPELIHLYAEGPSLSIADIILWPCFHLALYKLSSPSILQLIPLVNEWHDRILGLDHIKVASTLLFLPKNNYIGSINVDKLLVEVPQESLYKSDPRRYKPRHRLFTKQDEIEESLKLAEPVHLSMLSEESFGVHRTFDWNELPLEARPEGGALPDHRAGRKSEQLQAMGQAVMSVARDGDIIVDFCSGSGHLGILLACTLQKCTVVLLENKEESMNRARERSAKLQLTNILFLQTNVDYFTGHFTLGVSLHACGVATDLVLETCIARGAVFVSCPCCYGSVQPNHVIQYPRSEEFKSLPMTERQYLVLGHAADQTHGEDNDKTKQGLVCMDLVDGDRCLRARESGFTVYLTKLKPTTCTPKNNLLIGIPHHRQ